MSLDTLKCRSKDQSRGLRLPHRHWFYLLDGKAKDPKNDPSAFHGWIDYYEGLWGEGTLTYSWAQVETKQKYMRLQNTWVLTYQYLYSKKYDASLEAVFSNFQFAH